MDFPGKNTRVDCHAPLQGIFPAQGLSLGLLQVDSLPSEPPEKPQSTSAITFSILCNSRVCFCFQRHFTVFAFNFPSLDALNTIYSQILSFHFQQQAFGPSVLRSGPTLIQATISFHQTMARTFLPTAIKFHYLFNLRDLSNVFQVPQGLCVYVS